MSNVIFTADVHLGVPNRLRDTMWGLRVLREYAARQQIDTVVVLGDLFHDRVSINIEVLNETFKFFRETVEKYGQKWITFPGNHDMFLRHSWQNNSLQPLNGLLTVIDSVKQLYLDDQRFWVLPFIQHEGTYLRVVSEIQDRADPSDILLTHIGVRGALYNTCFLLRDWHEIDFEQSTFARIYTGHFHSRQQLGTNLWYPGSLIPFKFDEGDVPHGFFVYDLVEKKHKFVDIWKAGKILFKDETPAPQFLNIKLSSLEQLNQLEADVELGRQRPVIGDILPDLANVDWAHSQVRVTIDHEVASADQLAIRDSLLERGAVGVRWLHTRDKGDKDKDKTIAALGSLDQLKGEGTISARELFRIWLEQEQPEGLDHDLLKMLNDEVCRDGDEQYMTVSAEAGDDL